MRENFVDRVKECFPSKNGNSILKLEDDKGVDDYEKKLVNTMTSHSGSHILSHSKILGIEVNNQIDGFQNNSTYRRDTDSRYIHLNYRSSLNEKGFFGKSLGLRKNDYGNSGLFYAWFLAPKIKYCIVIDDFGVILATKTFKG